MGNLTDDMTKLSREVIRSRETREAFVNGLKEGVSEMLADFGKTRTEMANNMKSELRSFANDLKTGVAEVREELATDLLGARRAWSAGNRAADAKRRVVLKKKPARSAR